MRKAILLISFALVSHFSLSQQLLGFSIQDGKRKVEIPFELYNNLVVVPVLLNDMLPLKFIVDTGVQTAILTQKAFIDILNLPYSRKYTLTGAGGVKLVEAYVTSNVSLELPGVQGRGHAVLVLEEDYLELRNYLGTDVHGILGYELFSRFIVTIDYSKRILTIEKPHKFRVSKKYEKLPMKVEDTKPYIICPVELADGTNIAAKLLVDTGASHGLLLEPASDPRIKLPPNTVSSNIGRGIGGEITGKVGRVRSVSFGKYILKDAIANFPDPNSYMDSLKLGKTFRNGTLGGEVLSRFTVILNFSKEEIFLKKNAAFKKKFYYNLSGLTVKAIGSNLSQYEITEVRSESPAESAGVQEGDIINTINGIPTKIIDLHGLLARLNSRPGRKIRMELLRGDQLVKTEYILEDPLALSAQ